MLNLKNEGNLFNTVFNTSEKWLLFKKDLNAKKIQKVTFKVCSS